MGVHHTTGTSQVPVDVPRGRESDRWQACLVGARDCSPMTIARKLEVVSSEEDVPQFVDASYKAAPLVAYRASVGIPATRALRCMADPAPVVRLPASGCGESRLSGSDARNRGRKDVRSTEARNAGLRR